MPTRRTTVDHAHDLDWWRDTVDDLTASGTYPPTSTAVSADVDHTTITTRFNPTTGQRVPRLVVADTDVALAHTKAGRWVIVHALETVRRTPRWGRTRLAAAITCALTALACGYTVATTNSAGSQLFAAVVAAATTVTATWVGWHEWTVRRDRLIGADVAATRRYGLPAALTALGHTDRDPLYRTGFHTFVATRNPIALANRIERLSTQFTPRPRRQR